MSIVITHNTTIDPDEFLLSTGETIVIQSPKDLRSALGTFGKVHKQLRPRNLSFRGTRRLDLYRIRMGVVLLRDTLRQCFERLELTPAGPADLFALCWGGTPVGKEVRGIHSEELVAIARDTCDGKVLDLETMSLDACHPAVSDSTGRDPYIRYAGYRAM
jgi:hypothetical protein